MSQGHKIFLLIFLSTITTIVLCSIFKILIVKKRERNKRNFANPRYVIGAAIINMERALLYDEPENFLFFARYIIRTCLGMPRSYPPNEPEIADVSAKMVALSVAQNLSQKTLNIYQLKEIPHEKQEAEKVFANIKDTLLNLADYLNL